jgi:DNA-binding LacI/PurR family transcriptional regulator/signal transduction histidine kinase
MKTNQNVTRREPGKKTYSETGRFPTIGYLVTETIDAYNGGIHAGLIDAARELGVNVISFLGGQLRSSPTDPFAYQRNAAYDLVTANSVDGLIINCTLGNFVTTEELGDFFAQYHPLPIVSIGKEIPGIVSVLVDNEKGMRDVIVHLIEKHNCLRIAFLRGPEGNPEAELRYQAYASVLTEYGLPLDPDLVVSGDFMNASGADAIRLLLNERKVDDLQAVVAANDGMALGALDALQARGVRVPDDVAVVGFDDIEDAKAVTPSLTTVWQPLLGQGKLAVEKLMALLAGKQVPGQVTQSTGLVVRQSCGCLDSAVVQAAAGTVTSVGEPHEADLIAHRERIFDEMTKALEVHDEGIKPRWVKPLWEAFVAEVTSHSPGVFLAELNNVLHQIIATGGDVASLNGTVSALRRFTLPYLGGEMLRQSEDLWGQARVSIGLTAQQQQAYQALQTERHTDTLQEIEAVLAVTFDMDELINVLAEGLPRLGIPGCYLALYDDAQPHENSQPVPEWCRLMLAYTEKGRVKLEPGGRRFRPHELVPEGLWSQDKLSAFVLEPLYFQKNRLGFVLFEVGPQDGRIYEMLRAQLSSALQSALLVQQVESHARELEDAYHTLQKQQEMLLIVEKMASLGRLTAGIAHEMNTPLAAVRSALSTMTKLIQEYQDAIGDPEVTVDDHLEIAQEMQQIVALATKAAERASGFVHGIKSQTRALASQDHVLFDAVPVTREALLLLGHILRERKCEVVFESSEDAVEMHGAPGRFAQIVTNLVANAADASLSKGGGTITLRLVKRPNEVELQVIDLGCGIALEILPRIYDPMFTTKPFGQSTGLGLTIVHDIVTGGFGGTIEVSSKVGEGTTFTVHFPAIQGE